MAIPKSTAGTGIRIQKLSPCQVKHPLKSENRKKGSPNRKIARRTLVMIFMSLLRTSREAEIPPQKQPNTAARMADSKWKSPSKGRGRNRHPRKTGTKFLITFFKNPEYDCKLVDKELPSLYLLRSQFSSGEHPIHQPKLNREPN